MSDKPLQQASGGHPSRECTPAWPGPSAVALVHLARGEPRAAAQDHAAAQALAQDAASAAVLAELWTRLGDAEAAARWRVELHGLDPAAC